MDAQLYTHNLTELRGSPHLTPQNPGETGDQARTWGTLTVGLAAACKDKSEGQERQTVLLPWERWEGTGTRWSRGDALRGRRATGLLPGCTTGHVPVAHLPTPLPSPLGTPSAQEPARTP